jgi:3-deoxy-D-manno-octulosonic acid (KDO) 8-phosphate synthase
MMMTMIFSNIDSLNLYVDEPLYYLEKYKTQISFTLTHNVQAHGPQKNTAFDKAKLNDELVSATVARLLRSYGA